MESVVFVFLFLCVVNCNGYIHRQKRQINPMINENLFEGDIKGITAADIHRLIAQSNSISLRSTAPGANDPHDGAAIRDPFAQWPFGELFYELSNQFTENEKNTIRSALDEYHRRTCIRIIPRTNQQYYVSVKKMDGCWSFVGRQDEPQDMSLGDGCIDKGRIIHEFMHALGFFHEQSRWDRDQYIDIIKENIMRNRERNFEKYNLKVLKNLNTVYDYGSIMHYEKDAFSKNGQPTIIPKQNVEIGQRLGFSEVDVQELNAMYNCGDTTDPSVIQTTQDPFPTLRPIIPFTSTWRPMRTTTIDSNRPLAKETIHYNVNFFEYVKRVISSDEWDCDHICYGDSYCAKTSFDSTRIRNCELQGPWISQSITVTAMSECIQECERVKVDMLWRGCTGCKFYPHNGSCFLYFGKADYKGIALDGINSWIWPFVEKMVAVGFLEADFTDLCKSDLAANPFECKNDYFADAAILMKCIGIKEYTPILLNYPWETDVFPFLISINENAANVSFSTPLGISGYHFITKGDKDTTDVENAYLQPDLLLKPLQWNTWIVIGFGLLLCGLFTLVVQQLRVIIKELIAKLLFYLVNLFGIVLMGLYLCNLMAIVNVKPRPMVPFRNVEELTHLVEKGEKTLVNENFETKYVWSVLSGEEIINDEYPESLQNLYNATRNNPSLEIPNKEEICKQLMRNSSLVYLGRLSDIEQYCSQYCLWHLPIPDIPLVFGSYSVKTNSTLLEPLNLCVDFMRTYTTTKVRRSKKWAITTCKHALQSNMITLKSIISALWILGGGFTFGFSILFIERYILRNS